jgi:transposase-like protein
LNYTHEASKPGLKERILQMAINGCGVADMMRVLKMGKSTVLRTIKKNWWGAKAARAGLGI